jgi:hypothetical protein
MWYQTPASFDGGEVLLADIFCVAFSSGCGRAPDAFERAMAEKEEAGRNKSGDSLAISIDEPRKYECWAGCSKEMIRAALGFPILIRQSAHGECSRWGFWKFEGNKAGYGPQWGCPRIYYRGNKSGMSSDETVQRISTLLTLTASTDLFATLCTSYTT